MFTVVFLCFSRDVPTKLDSEVLLAIEAIDVSPQQFPSIHKWKSTMRSYSKSDMQRLVASHCPSVQFAQQSVLSTKK